MVLKPAKKSTTAGLLNRAAVFDSMDYAAAPPALKESGAASEIIGNVLSTLEMNDISAQDALDDIQSQLEDAGLL